MSWRRLLQIVRRTISPFPLRAAANPLATPPFFLLAPGRSGGNLLRAILWQHPNVCVPPEAVTLGRVIKRYQGIYATFPWPQLVRLVALELAATDLYYTWRYPLRDFLKAAEAMPDGERDLAHLIDTYFLTYARARKPAASRWGDRSAFNVEFLPQLEALFPQAQYVHLVRDGRDVVASRLDRGWFKDAAAAADSWRQQVELAAAAPAANNKSRFLELRYENLVVDPEKEIRRLCQFLALDFHPDMLQPHLIAGQLDGIDPVHHASQFEPINTGHIGQWRQRLSREDQQEVGARLAPILTQYSYDLDATEN